MLLEARNVTRAFGSFKAVDAASVTLEQGDILGLIGPNGAGKSTFFNCLTGDILSTSGKVLFEGHDITNMPPEARARLGLARTFQVPQTFESMSVLESDDRRVSSHLPSRRRRGPGARRAGARRHEQTGGCAGALARHPQPQAAGDRARACDRAQGSVAR
jgi:ABC-type branched-subunit amino acid transport system ATPase component